MSKGDADQYALQRRKQRVFKYIGQDGVSALSLINTFSTVKRCECKFREQAKKIHTSIWHR